MEATMQKNIYFAPSLEEGGVGGQGGSVEILFYRALLPASGS